MTQNNNTSVLPFYMSLNEQNHRRSYSYGDIYPLYTPTNKIPPFQVITPSGWWGSVSAARIVRMDGVEQMNISGEISNNMTRVQKTGYDVLVYRGAGTISEIPEGQYYIVMADGSHTLYSEVFTAVKVITNYLKIEWYDIKDMEYDGWGIVYQLGLLQFVNRLYLNVELGKPDYVFDEEGEQRDGYFFPEKQISEKTYKCTILAPEYLCDVMRFIRMSDVISVVDSYGRTYSVDTFLITPKWQDQGNLASVEIEFQTATVAKKIGRAM